MKSLRPLLIATLAALACVPALAQTADTEARVIVRFKPQSDSVRAKAMALRATRAEAREVAQTRATALGLRTGHRLAAGISLDERTQVVLAKGMTSAQLARRLAADGEVELVAVDQRRKHMKLPNDPLFGGADVNPESTVGGIQARVIDQWYLKAPSSTPGQVVSSINAPAAWDTTTGSATAIVAVLDTGVRMDHPDLAGQFVSGYDMIGFGSPGATATAIANDGGGADDNPSDPGDWVSQADINGGTLGSGCDSSDIGNSSWHGTRVSGLIGAASNIVPGTNNGIGMAGVAPGVKIMPVRVLGKCGGYDSDIMAGMKWAAGIAVPGLPANANKAKVLNLSLGGSGGCDIGDTAALYKQTIAQVNAAGATIVVAAGNSEGQSVGLPGNCPGVITVAALRHVGTKVGFSSLGKEVTIAAPGGNCINIGAGQACLYPMVSTTNSGATGPETSTYTGSGVSVGTSFSAPIVSGIVGLMASVRPSLTSAEATQIFKATARPFPTTGGTAGILQCQAPSGAVQDECYCTTSTCGAGMVDAAAAVAAAAALNSTTVAITQSPVSGLTAGQTLTLTAAATGLPAGRTVASTAWVIVDGGSIVTAFASGAAAATATITPTAAGSFTVRADVTDSAGLIYSQTATVSVAAAPVVTPPATGSGGGGGGGAASAAWLAGLLLAALALRRSAARG